MNSDDLNKRGAQSGVVSATTPISDFSEGADLGHHTVVIGPTSKGMSALSDTLIEEYKRRGAKLVVMDVGPSSRGAAGTSGDAAGDGCGANSGDSGCGDGGGGD